jgi:hypothetical protein
MAHARSGAPAGVLPREPIVDGSVSDEDLPTLLVRLGDGDRRASRRKLTLLKLDLEDTVRGYG